MSGNRPWQVTIWRENHGAPMLSLGIHVDLHTPTLDFHLPFWLVQIGRNGYWGINGRIMGGQRSYLAGRLLIDQGVQWSGHSDNCDHEREPAPADDLADANELSNGC